MQYFVGILLRVCGEFVESLLRVCGEFAESLWPMIPNGGACGVLVDSMKLNTMC